MKTAIMVESLRRNMKLNRRTFINGMAAAGGSPVCKPYGGEDGRVGLHPHDWEIV